MTNPHYKALFSFYPSRGREATQFAERRHLLLVLRLARPRRIERVDELGDLRLVLRLTRLRVGAQLVAHTGHLPTHALEHTRLHVVFVARGASR